MSDQEFQEIRLSGKQLVFLFMFAVVLAVVIFLLGVAVGRGVRGALGDRPDAVQAGGTDTLVPDEPPVAPAAELGYHDLLLGAGAAGTPPVGEPPTPPMTEPPTPPMTEPPPPPVGEPPTPPMTETAPPPTPAPATAAADGWFLQTGAYSTRQVADSQVTALKKLRVPAFVLVPSAGSPDQLFRVRVGPYPDRPDAEQVRARLQREGYKPALVAR